MLAIRNDRFELSFDVMFNLGGALQIKAVGFAGIYNDGAPGLVLRLAVSVKVTIPDPNLPILKIEASGELLLNTTARDRNANG